MTEPEEEGGRARFTHSKGHTLEDTPKERAGPLSQEDRQALRVLLVLSIFVLGGVANLWPVLTPQTLMATELLKFLLSSGVI